MTHRKSRFANDRVVFELLKREARALSAYQITERLHSKGISSPMTVYRSLSRLLAEGWVHRIESLNAYIAAVDPKTQAASLYAVCRECGDTEQVYDQTFATRLNSWAVTNKFEVEQVTFELKGRCNSCSRSSSKPVGCTS